MRVVVVRGLRPGQRCSSPGCTRDAYIGFLLDEAPGQGYGQAYCRECWAREASTFDSEDHAERLLAATQELRYLGIRPDALEDRAASAEVFKRYGLLGDEKGRPSSERQGGTNGPSDG